jgi:glycosyltransferase involved in cell wall biosynthesis
MKVLLVCLADFRAPGARQTLRLAEALTAAGEQCMVLVEGDPETIRFDTDRDSEVEVHRYDFSGPFVDRRTRSLVSRFAPDLVHCYEPRTAPLSASLQLSRREGAALCVRFADDDESLAKEAGGSGLRGRLGRPAMLALGTLFPRRWPYKHPLLYRRMVARASGFDAIVPTLAAAVGERYGIECESILPAIPAGEPPQPQAGLRERLGLPDTGQIVLYTGSVYRAQYPDLELLLRAFAMLADSNPDALLVHTGRIAPRYSLDRLRAMAGAGADRSHFLGFLEDPADLQALLAEASVLVQPGSPTDFNRLRLPAKVHDYLLTGRPTVSFAVGFGELLRDRENAVLTQTGEPGELATSLEWVLANPDRAEEIGRRGRARALELFDPEAIAGQTVAYYERALARSRRSGQ